MTNPAGQAGQANEQRPGPGAGRCAGSQRRVGAITIGQSPRSDLTPELAPLLGPGIQVVEAGALDPLSPAEIAALAPAPGEPVLVSRLRDGRSVRLRREALPPLLQAAAARLAGEVDLVLLLCTGSLPPLTLPQPVLYPEHLLFQVVRGIGGPVHPAPHRRQQVGIITPVAEQVVEQRDRWAAVLGSPPEVVASSPYEPAHPAAQAAGLRAAAAHLQDAGARLLVMDCLGYTRWMKQVVRQETGLPVILARTVLARVAAELLDPH